MDMTVSMFESFFDRMPAVRADRMMDMSQSVIYGQVTPDGRTKIWNGWLKIKSTVTRMMTTDISDLSKSVITWNGAPINIDNLKNKFRSMFGRGAVQ